MKKIKYLALIAALLAAVVFLNPSSTKNFKLDKKNNTAVAIGNTSIPLLEEFKSDLNHFVGLSKKILGATSSGNEQVTKTDDTEIVNNTGSDATGLQPVSGSALQKVSLVRVVDGDTLVVNDGNADFYVRLIGIDTPESVNPDETKNTTYGEIASTFTKDLLKNVSDLWLQYDVETADKYDRTLAYVWLKEQVDTSSTTDIENYMVNGIILRNGFAIDKVFLPNAMYADVFSEIRQRAEENRCGLWEVEGFDTLIYG